VNYPGHRAGHLKKLDEGDCIPLPSAPHSSPSTGRGILREGFIKNMKITIRPMAEFRDMLGRKKIYEIPEGKTVQAFLHELTQADAAFGEAVFDAEDQIRPYVNILKNGKHLGFLESSEMMLADGDVITIFSYAAGG
jgi:sulfur-carrier protein